jgi:hypothetical protein
LGTGVGEGEGGGGFTARAVKIVKSRIIARRETKSMFSDMRLNASRGMRTGAPIARTSNAC